MLAGCQKRRTLAGLDNTDNVTKLRQMIVMVPGIAHGWLDEWTINEVRYVITAFRYWIAARYNYVNLTETNSPQVYNGRASDVSLFVRCLIDW